MNYLTPNQVAARLRVSKNKVGEWIKAGTLPAINVSRAKLPRYRIRPDDLEAFERRLMPDRKLTTVVATRRNKPAVEYV